MSPPSDWLSESMRGRSWCANHRRAMAAIAGAVNDRGIVQATFANLARETGVRPAAIDKVVARLELRRWLQIVEADFKPRASRRDRSYFRARVTLRILHPAGAR